MSNYSIEMTKSVENDLDDLKHHRDRAVEKILNLETDPKDKSSALKGNLQGLYSYKFDLPGSGTFRAIYFTKEVDQVCLLVIVAARENIYLRASRRYQQLQDQDLIK